MKKRISIILVSLFILITSCESDKFIYENNQGFINNTWSYEDAKSFSVDITDTLIPIKLFINLRTTTDYPYRNIYMFFHSNYPNGYTDIDTFEFFLADQEGHWLGDNSGTVVENRAIISRGYFPTVGEYNFKIEQAMRNDSLPEVLDVGVRIEIISDN